MKLILAVAALLSGCAMINDYDFVSKKAESFYASRGFKVTSYQGYSLNVIGRMYWYTTEKDGVLYESGLLRWGDEIHEYNLKAINALSGGKK